MAMKIENDETERLIRDLAAATGESVTTAVTIAVRERLERVRTTALSAQERTARVVKLGRQIAAALGPNPMRIGDLCDDETGLPA